jgi:HAE1 family hydrophobic/amphiphilic exporter-1
MTTVMLVAAMIPIATGSGPGAGARASMAKVILGGQLLSLLLSLLVTPVAYSIWDDALVRGKRIAARIGRYWGQPTAAPAPPPEPEPEETRETVFDVPAHHKGKEPDAAPTGS